MRYDGTVSPILSDGIVFKVRDNGKIINKTVYLCVGLKQNGLKEVLGMWVGKSESSSFWMGVLTDLKARGVQDILITSFADQPFRFVVIAFIVLQVGHKVLPAVVLLFRLQGFRCRFKQVRSASFFVGFVDCTLSEQCLFLQDEFIIIDSFHKVIYLNILFHCAMNVDGLCILGLFFIGILLGFLILIQVGSQLDARQCGFPNRL